MEMFTEITTDEGLNSSLDLVTVLLTETMSDSGEWKVKESRLHLQNSIKLSILLGTKNNNNKNPALTHKKNQPYILDPSVLTTLKMKQKRLTK